MVNKNCSTNSGQLKCSRSFLSSDKWSVKLPNSIIYNTMYICWSLCENKNLFNKLWDNDNIHQKYMFLHSCLREWRHIEELTEKYESSGQNWTCCEWTGQRSEPVFLSLTVSRWSAACVAWSALIKSGSHTLSPLVSTSVPHSSALRWLHHIINSIIEETY